MTSWRGRPWEEAVIYELHVGTFTPEGTFAAAIERLDYLAELGVTAIELMPVADFPGAAQLGLRRRAAVRARRGYGTPEISSAWSTRRTRAGSWCCSTWSTTTSVPKATTCTRYAPQFFTERHHTPWGAAINFDGAHSRTVRDFFIHNALYWLEEYPLRRPAPGRGARDRRRLRAGHPRPSSRAPCATARAHERHVHLVLENDRNEARYLERDAQRRPLHATRSGTTTCITRCTCC